jgi:glucosamine--fructose-6-phosphate aminotransferase (isomerizing)
MPACLRNALPGAQLLQAQTVSFLEPWVKRAGHQPPRKSAHKKLLPDAIQGAPGRHTLREILSQPAVWAETELRVARGGIIDRLGSQFTVDEPWLFVACGSSYYLSQLISAVWRRNFSIRCTAVPASELLFAPEETLRSSGAKEVVFVSRSGETTEVLRAADLLRQRGDIKTLGVTCNAASPFQSLCTQTFALPWADEKSTVMTRSFTAMLLSFLRIGAQLRGDAQLSAALHHLPQAAQSWLGDPVERIRQFATRRSFADFVFLGQGAHYWLAQEAALKLTEMSASYAQAYHTLEFRHGPRSIAGPATLVTFFISDAAAAEEALLVRELKSLNAANLVIVNRATPDLKASSDLLVELDQDGPEFARLAMAAIPAQVLGAAVGLRKGLDPDSPKNLTRAVVLGDSAAPEKITLRIKVETAPPGSARNKATNSARGNGGRV